MLNRIFSFDSPKAVKSLSFGWLNAIQYMAPHKTAGKFNLCAGASEGCINLCLGLHSGQAAMVPKGTGKRDGGNLVRRSRREKARRFMFDRAAYMRDVVRSIELAQLRAERLGLQLCVRLNGSMDIPWEGIKCERNGVKHRNLFEVFPELQFVDYTKIASRMLKKLPPNYHLTFSRSETNEEACKAVLANGGNVAVVFSKKIGRPETWLGFPTIDGDQHDLRHLDPKGVVVALTPKGHKALRDKSGFVIQTRRK